MNWLEQRLKELELTQEELATRLQLEGLKTSRSTISAWVTGRNTPKLKDTQLRQALAKALKLPTRELLKRAGYETEDTDHTKEAELAAMLIDQMTPEDRDKAIRLLEVLSN